MSDIIVPALTGFTVGILFALVFQIANIRKRLTALSRVEGKLDLMLKNAGLEYNPLAEISEDLAQAIESGQKIQAIKLYRQTTECSLKEAKDYIEELQRRIGTP